ncbi:MAG: diguanylate cyclase [Defluviitaleaceae bacterium]|nr:diguanylate cyclase [Defluviitaleaceae bacterium]
MIKRKFKILIIDDSQLVRESLRDMLLSDTLAETRGLSWQRDVETAASGEKGLVKVRSYKPDLILLDIIMQGSSGFDVLETLKKSEETRDIPVILITSLGDAENEETGMLLGAADYISKPVNENIALSRIATHQKVIEQMRKIERDSLYDPLTDIFNRRSFDIHSKLMWDYCIRENQPIGVLILDIDDFNQFNDNYGTQQGDLVLKAVAEILVGTKKRTVDKVFRCGGAEFAAILPGSTLEKCLKTAERFRKKISNIAVPQENGTSLLLISASIGVASTMPTEDSSLAPLIRRADKAMYMAKETGKNKVCGL